MEKDVFKALLEKAKKIEEEFGELENFAKITTNCNEKHRMKMKEDFSSEYKDMSAVYQELYDLELADLLDFQNFIGRFDGEFS
ncbi:MAG: hypothetical protein K2K31_01965 [Clostridia bacterium]|nr:hypothetical protein [Clostridia bacterium]